MKSTLLQPAERLNHFLPDGKPSVFRHLDRQLIYYSGVSRSLHLSSVRTVW